MSKNILLSAGIGLASGYSYNKCAKLVSLTLGIGFITTNFKNHLIKLFDLNHDGKIDDQDLQIVEDKTGINIDLISCISFVGGFGTGYISASLY